MARGRMINKNNGRHTIPVAIRLAIIIKDRCRCHYCGKQGEAIMRYGNPTVVENPKSLNLRDMDWYNGPDVIAFHFDHIMPVSAGGQNTEDNLVLTCRTCNLSKGAKIHGQ